MNIIEQASDLSNGSIVPHTYKYALRVTPDQIYDMPREQLIEVALEFYWLISIIVSIVRNPWSLVTSRVIALDLLFEAVRRSARDLKNHDIFSPMPICISSDSLSRESICRRLGLHKNTVGPTITSIADAGLIEKDDRETGKGRSTRHHIDIALNRNFIENPHMLMDKTERKVPKSDKAPIEKIEKQLPCVACGSENTDTYEVTVCQDCGNPEWKTQAMVAEREGKVLAFPVPAAASASPVEVVEDRAPAPLYKCRHCHTRNWVWMREDSEWACRECWTPSSQSEAMMYFYDHSRLGEALRELERAARLQVDPDAWVYNTMTSDGWDYYIRLTIESEGK